MKYILKQIYNKLIGDSTLTTLVGYSGINKNIVRFESLQKYTFDRFLLFGKLRANNVAYLDTHKVKVYFMDVQAMDKIEDIVLDDIIERVIELLSDAKIEETGQILAPQIMWDGYTSATYYDNELNYYIKNTRFKMIVKDMS